MSCRCSPAMCSALCLALVLALLTGFPGAVGKDKSQAVDEDVSSHLVEGDATVTGVSKEPATGVGGGGQQETTGTKPPTPAAQTNATANTATRTGSSIDPISLKILRVQDDGIWVSDLVLNSTKAYANLTEFKGYSVDYHYEKRLVVYTDFGKIYKDEVVGRLVRSGKMPSFVVSAAGLTRLAVDWLHDRVYWMSDDLRAVEAIDLNGANRTTVIDSLPYFEYPNNLAVDPYQGFLFFVSNHSIYRSDLQGEDLTQISPAFEGVMGVKSLTLDVPTKRLYFSGKSGKVKTGRPYVASCGYEGEGVKLYKLRGRWNDIYSVAFFKGTLYFAHFQDDQSDAVYSADVASNTDAAEIAPKRTFTANANGGIWSITVYHPDKQKETKDGD